MNAQLAVTALGGAAVGALLTGIVTLVTTVLNRRHEHRRWLQDKRLEAYANFNAALATWQLLQIREPEEETTADAIRDLVTRRAEVILLAARDVGLTAVETTQAALESFGRASEGDHEASHTAMERTRELSLRLMGLQMRDIQGTSRRQKLRHLMSHLPQRRGR